MSLFFGVMTYSEEPYLAYTLKNIYNHAAKIVVIEGHVREFWDLPFSDYTEKVVSKIDKNNKIIYKNVGKVIDKYDLTAKELEILHSFVKPKDWLIMMGADEAWSHTTLDWLETLPPDILWVGIPFDDFYGDFQHVFLPRYIHERIPFHGGFPDKNGNRMINGMYHERVYRYEEGWNYWGNHVSVKDRSGRYIYADLRYTKRRIYLGFDTPHRWYHYGWVTQKDWAFQRLSYYQKKEKWKISVKDSPKYKYLSTGDLNGIGKDSVIVEMKKDYTHPFPFGTHPYANLTREEIFNGKKWTFEDITL